MSRFIVIHSFTRFVKPLILSVSYLSFALVAAKHCGCALQIALANIIHYFDIFNPKKGILKEEFLLVKIITNAKTNKFKFNWMAFKKYTDLERYSDQFEVFWETINLLVPKKYDRWLKFFKAVTFHEQVSEIENMYNVFLKCFCNANA